MSYDDFIDALAERVDGLQPPQRAAVFWLAGTALRAELSDDECSGWSPWFSEASDLGLEFILEGRVGDRFRAVWERASASTGPGASQLLNSAIICLSSPLVIGLEPEKAVGNWIEHALFPVVEKVSMDLFGDVAFPDDDGLEEVFADARFRASSDYCTSLCALLEASPQLEREALAELLQGAKALTG